MPTPLLALEADLAALAKPEPTPTHLLAAELAHGKVPPHLRRKVGDDDLAQELLVKVHDKERTGAFDGREEAEVRQFLRKTLASVVTDLVRHYDTQTRHAGLERSIDQAPDGSSGPLASRLVSDYTPPSQKAVREEQLRRLAQALADLPDDQRRAIQLHHLEQLTSHDTASLMGRTLPEVAGLLFRGLRTLRARLEPLR